MTRDTALLLALAATLLTATTARADAANAAADTRASADTELAALLGCADACNADGAIAAGWRWQGSARRPDAIELRFSRVAEARASAAAAADAAADAATDATVVLRAHTDPRAFTRTARFALGYERARGAEVVALTKAVTERVAQNEARVDLTLTPTVAPAPNHASPAARSDAVADGAPDGATGALSPIARRSRAPSALDGALTPLAQLLWLLTALALAGSLRALLRRWHTADASGARLEAALLGVGVLARLLAPMHLVMYFMGYEQLTAALADGPTPKYGPGVVVAERALLQLFGERVEVLVAFNRLSGALALPVALALAHALVLTRRARLLALAALALTPALVADATSESMWPPALLVTLIAWERWLAFWRSETNAGLAVWSPALGAFAAGALALWSRPELLVVLPIGVVVFTRVAPAPTQRLRGRRPIVAAIALGLLAAWLARALQLDAALAAEAALGNTPEVFRGGLFARAFGLLRDGLWRKNALLEPRVFPFALTFAVALLALPRRAGDDDAVTAGVRSARGLLALSAVALVPGAADLPWVSLPRIHAPAMFLAAFAAGPAIDALVARGLPTPAPSRALRRRLGVLAALFGLSAAHTVATLWAAHHPQQSHTLWQRARLALQQAHAGDAGGALLGRRDHDDAPDERVHLGFPDGDARALGVEPVSLTTLVAATGRTRYVWLDSRCAMRPCGGLGEHPSCARARALGLEPVVTARLRPAATTLGAGFEVHSQPREGERGDLDFPWCLQASTAEIGLYRVRSP